MTLTIADVLKPAVTSRPDAPNDFDIVVAFHGAQRVGAIWAGINEAYLAAEQQVLSMLLTARAGGCCVLTGRRDAEGVAEWIAAERVTVWNGVPAQLHDLARRPGFDLSSLAEVWCGGAGTPEELRRAFEDACHVPVRATYGLSEAPTVVAIDLVGAPARLGVSGLLLPHLDVAAYSADGWLTVTDRKKLIIVRGGANVYPAEVERVIRRHPAVAALVQLRGAPASPGPTADLAETEALCRTELARYKIPEAWSVVDAFPLNPMGKIIRTGLAALLKD